MESSVSCSARQGGESEFRDFRRDAWLVDNDHSEFLARFKRENGRPPRILNIGNIANNAFKNATILRRHGIECDVLCYDYYHVMGCPEWEHATFPTDNVNFDAPAWRELDLGDYQRPRWFAQGRLLTAIDYLVAFRNKAKSVDELWQCLLDERDSGGKEFRLSSQPSQYNSALVVRESDRLAALFEVTFPSRPKKPSSAEISAQYGWVLNERVRLQRLFCLYDLVVGYATDGLLPLVARKTPYVCFEHGTIRTFPFEDTLFGQMCALSYACAQDVLITNCDNIVAARRLGLSSLRFLPHAMLEDFRSDPSATALRETLLKDHAADFIVFHPSRQHWSQAEDLNWEKGNDRLIRAFARFQQAIRPMALLVMVEWGQTIEQSRSLIAELGVASRVVWLKPQPMPVVGRYVAAADVLADQFVIGAWGAIMPHGMMLGTPTMLFLNEELHEWCFPTMPPILNSRTEAEIFEALAKATDPAYRARIKMDGVAWYNSYHSEDVVFCRLIESLKGALMLTAAVKNSLIQRELYADILIAGNALQTGPQSLMQARSMNAATIGGGVLSSPPALRIRMGVRNLRSRNPVLGTVIYHALYWPMRIALWLRSALANSAKS